MEATSNEQNQKPDAKEAAIDLEALAEIILDMLKRELLLEVERIGR